MTHPAIATRPLLINGEALKISGIQAPNTGGGPKYEPRTAEEARRILLPQIDTTVAAAIALPDSLRAPNSFYIEARLLPNYLAASYFPSSLLAYVGATSVGSRADVAAYTTAKKQQTAQTRRLIISVDDGGLQELQRLVRSASRNRTQDQAFSEIRKLDEIAIPRVEQLVRAPDELLTTADVSTWEAVLNPATNRSGEPVALDDETMQRWLNLVESRGGTVHQSFIRRVGGLTFVPVSTTGTAIQSLARFNPLRVLRPMPTIRPRPGFGVRSVANVIAPTDPQPQSLVTSVAVFDGGVDPTADTALFPVATAELTTEPTDAQDLAHGTGVTAAVLYGAIEAGDRAPQPPLPVTSYRVLPSPPIPNDLEGYWVLDRIVEAVQQNGHHIVNLSLGPRRAVEDDMEPHRWTSELDRLAWDNDVLFIVAAGNDGDQDQATGLHRVQVPADMANGLAVGACDRIAPDTPWNRAPYSSMGPGRYGNRIQPLGVQFGGTAAEPFNVVRHDGSLSPSWGTSLAAPVTTHALADLVTRLPRSNSSVLRAFAVHFAERHREHLKRSTDFGYGRQPLDYDRAMQCGPGEAHVLFIDEITRGDLLAYQLPIPEDAVGDVKVRLTLAYASPCEPTEPTEYTSAAIDLTLRPHQHMHTFRPPTNSGDKPVVLDITSPPARELLTAGWDSSQEPVTKTLSAPAGSTEVKLRDSGKWETIRHHRITLKEAETSLPRLEVSYVARRGGALDNAPTAVPFALLVTVENKRDERLYDKVTRQYGALRPAQRAATRVRTRTANPPSSWH